MGVIASQITSLTIVFSTVYLNTDQRKHQSSASLAFCVGNSPEAGEFPAQVASNEENVSIWWRHHVLIQARWDLMYGISMETSWQGVVMQIVYIDWFRPKIDYKRRVQSVILFYHHHHYNIIIVVVVVVIVIVIDIIIVIAASIVIVGFVCLVADAGVSVDASGSIL